MDEFLAFIGQWKALFYGGAFGFVSGVVLCMWSDIRAKR